MTNTRTDWLSKCGAISAGFPGTKSVLSPRESLLRRTMLQCAWAQSVLRLPSSLVSPSCKARQLETTFQSNLQNKARRTDFRSRQTLSCLRTSIPSPNMSGSQFPHPTLKMNPGTPKAWKGDLSIFPFSSSIEL